MIEASPTSAQADVYRQLARTVLEDRSAVIPKPLAVNDLRAWARKWGSLVLESEQGVVSAQAGI